MRSLLAATARAIAIALTLGGAIAGAAATGCRGRSNDAAPAPPAPGSVGPASTSPARPGEAALPNGSAGLSTADADALWALAPAGARGGLVASPRALALAERAVAALRGVLAAAPELAPWRQAFDELLEGELGIPRASLAELGLTGGKGFALFLVRGGMVAILPVADRAKLLARAGGAAASAGGDGFDRIGGVACTEARGVYACATEAALLATLGRGELAPRLAEVGARGDLELVGIELPLGGAAPGHLAAVVQLEPGAAVVRAAIAGVAPALAARLAGAHRPRVDPARTAAFAIGDLAALAGDALAERGGPALAELVRSLHGPLEVTVPAGQLVPEAEQALADPAPMRTVVDGCPILLRPFGLAASSAGGACRVELPIAGRGSLLALPPPVESGTAAATPALSPDAALRLRALALLSELGAAMRREGDALHAVVALRTAFANPDAVAAQLLAITAADVVTGRAAVTARQIAAGAPTSPFAADIAAGAGGLAIPAAMLEVATAIALPALLRHHRAEPTPPTPAP